MHTLLKKILILLIRLYQLCLSPFFGQCCRFAPSCSEYAQEALEKHGVWRGIWLTAKRMVKCGPWCRGGHDPVPESNYFREKTPKYNNFREKITKILENVVNVTKNERNP